MKCEILKDFKGTQDGMVVDAFFAGETHELSDYLFGCIDKSWVKVIEDKQGAPEIKAKDESKLKNKSGADK